MPKKTIWTAVQEIMTSDNTSITTVNRDMGNPKGKQKRGNIKYLKATHRSGHENYDSTENTVI